MSTSELIIYFIFAVVFFTAATRPLVNHFLSVRRASQPKETKVNDWPYIKPTLIYVALIINHLLFMVMTTWSYALKLNIPLAEALYTISDSIITHLIGSSVVLGVMYFLYMLIAAARNGHIKNSLLRNIANNW